MTKFAQLSDLSDATRLAVVDLLYRLADDALVMGHRGSEWTGLGPILEEDIAFSSMAQDEIGHAHMYYAMLHELGEEDPDTLVFGRSERSWRCAELVAMPNENEYGFCVLRKFLYDTAVVVRLDALANGSLAPLAQLAFKLRGEKKYHLMHGRGMVVRLSNGTEESRSRMMAAMGSAYPHALGLFESTNAEDELARAGICPAESNLRQQWTSAITPVLDDARLQMPSSSDSVPAGRSQRSPDALSSLLESMQLVYNIDPTAKW